MNETNYQISLLTAMNNRLITEEQMYHMICCTSSDAFLYYSFTEKRYAQMGNWSHFFSFEFCDSKSQYRLIEEINPAYVSEVSEILSLEKEKKDHDSVEFVIERNHMWVELQADVMYDALENPVEKLYTFKDITKFKRQSDELLYMAYYDSITGLYNRNYFVIQLQKMIQKAGEENTVISVLFIDVDGFRKINDGMGMVIGDELVQQIGMALKELKSDHILVSHFNSDIFCIAIYDPIGLRSVDSVIHDIKEKLNNPFHLSNGIDVSITVSIGVAEYPECTTNALDLIKCAEIVMFKSKHDRKNGVRYYDSSIVDEFVENIQIEHKLEQAIKKEGFFMCYQPQYSTDTKKLRGLEALVRWRDDDGKIISPAKFIPLAEKNGTILPLGDWIIEKSISDFTSWYQKYDMEGVVLSINVSALQFQNKKFVENLVRVLKKYQMPSKYVELEITESVMIENAEEVIDKMLELKHLGIRFSMDDFGTGFSSLSYLRKLPIDTLKIDKSFVDTVVTDNPTRTIAETIIELGKKLGFDTIAEGVEQDVQFRLLKDIGCENIQGFLLAKPMQDDKIENLLTTLYDKKD